MLQVRCKLTPFRGPGSPSRHWDVIFTRQSQAGQNTGVRALGCKFNSKSNLFHFFSWMEAVIWAHACALLSHHHHTHSAALLSPCHAMSSSFGLVAASGSTASFPSSHSVGAAWPPLCLGPCPPLDGTFWHPPVGTPRPLGPAVGALATPQLSSYVGGGSEQLPLRYQLFLCSEGRSVSHCWCGTYSSVAAGIRPGWTWILPGPVRTWGRASALQWDLSMGAEMEGEGSGPTRERARTFWFQLRLAG